MPLIHVSLFEGRTIEQKRAFVQAVTADAAKTLGCTIESVDIIFEDVDLGLIGNNVKSWWLSVRSRKFTSLNV